MASGKQPPSRWWFGLAAVIFAVGIAAFVWQLVSGLQSQAVLLQRMVAPGQAEFSLERAGEYTIYYEWYSVVDNQVYQGAEALPLLVVTVHDVDSGQEIPVGPAGSQETYSSPNHEGRSVFSFTVPAPGTYRISAENTGAEPAVLAVGQGVAMHMFKLILTGVAILLGTVGTAVIIVIVTLVRRSQAQR